MKTKITEREARAHQSPICDKNQWEKEFEQMVSRETWQDWPWLDTHWNNQAEIVKAGQLKYWAQTLPSAWEFSQINCTLPF